MKIPTALPIVAATLGLGAAAWVLPRASAEPFWVTVKVDLPYAVTVGDRTLPPGDYTVEQLHSEGSTMLLFYNGDGMKFEASARANRAWDPVRREDTRVTLDHIGDSYYIDKIWIQGKDSGYQLPLPKGTRELEKESEVVVPASAGMTLRPDR